MFFIVSGILYATEGMKFICPIVYVSVNECIYACVYNLNIYVNFLICGIPPKYGPSNLLRSRICFSSA